MSKRLGMIYLGSTDIALVQIHKSWSDEEQRRLDDLFDVSLEANHVPEFCANRNWLCRDKSREEAQLLIQRYVESYKAMLDNQEFWTEDIAS